MGWTSLTIAAIVTTPEQPESLDMSQKGRTKILSINVSEVKEVPYRGGTVTTGIFKVPLDGPVTVRKLNIERRRSSGPAGSRWI